MENINLLKEEIINLKQTTEDLQEEILSIDPLASKIDFSFATIDDNDNSLENLIDVKTMLLVHEECYKIQLKRYKAKSIIETPSDKSNKIRKIVSLVKSCENLRESIKSSTPTSEQPEFLNFNHKRYNSTLTLSNMPEENLDKILEIFLSLHSKLKEVHNSNNIKSDTEEIIFLVSQSVYMFNIKQNIDKIEMPIYNSTQNLYSYEKELIDLNATIAEILKSDYTESDIENLTETKKYYTISKNIGLYIDCTKIRRNIINNIGIDNLEDFIRFSIKNFFKLDKNLIESTLEEIMVTYTELTNLKKQLLITFKPQEDENKAKHIKELINESKTTEESKTFKSLELYYNKSNEALLTQNLLIREQILELESKINSIYKELNHYTKITVNSIYVNHDIYEDPIKINIQLIRTNEELKKQRKSLENDLISLRITSNKYCTKLLESINEMNEFDTEVKSVLDSLDRLLD